MEQNFIAKTRQKLRQRMTALRESLGPGEFRTYSSRIVMNLLNLFPQPPGGLIGFYWPIRNEPDIHDALTHWQKEGASLALPVVTAPFKPLSFYRWTPQTPMRPDRYGILAPLVENPDENLIKPDTLIIPLLAFDKKGYRLGYGGGFFDRTLAAFSALPPPPLTIGVGFELNRLESIDPEPHDKPLDWIVTEKGAYRIAQDFPP